MNMRVNGNEIYHPKDKIYCSLLRFLSALARTPPKTNIVALFERTSGKSD
jgi:hypothetical protein